MSSPPPKHSLSSPTSGNSPQPVLPTPSSSTSVSIRHNPAMLRQELERQLVEKQRQLQESHSGIGKNVLARQVSQLQDKLRDLDAVTKDSDTAPSSSSERLRSLERDFTSFRSHPLSPGMSSLRNKEKLLNQRSTTGLDPLPSPTTSTLLPPAHDSTSLLPLPPPPTGSTPTKRRSKVPNADRRNTDIEFATEIGQGLLLEVRKMQALLQEKEEKLRTLENQKADLERAAEAMTKQMRQREENEEKLKEETWNLELAKQELTISVTELQQNLSKASVEQNRLAKQVNELRSDIEHLRDREEKLNFTMDNMKQRHEQDMSSIRRHAAAVQREKSEQSKHIEALNSELAIAKAQSRISKHAHSELEPTARSEQPDDQTQSVLAVKSDASPSSSPPSSPKQSPRNQAMEVETLKTSLAHAHRMVHNLRSNLLKEKTEKFEFKKLLAESQETIELLQNDHSMWVDTHPRPANGATSDGAKRSFKGSGALTPKRRGLRKNRSGMARSALDDSETDSRRRRRKVSSTTADNDSVYSYSSMSELDEESSGDSDADTTSPTSIKEEEEADQLHHGGFRPLSSELSSSQKKPTPIVVDAEVNTEPVLVKEDDTSVPAGPRSLGDELGMAMSMPPSEQHNVIKDTTIDAAALSESREIKPEMSTQTDSKPELITSDNATQTIISKPVETCIQTDTLVVPQTDVLIQTEIPSLTDLVLTSISESPIPSVELQVVSLPALECEPEDPQIAQNAMAAAISQAIAADRARALESAIHTSIQSDPEDPSIAEAALAAAIAEALAAEKARTLERSVETSTQFDPEMADETMQAAFAEYRAASLGKAVSCETQSDPKVVEDAMKAAFVEYRNKSLDEAMSTATQSDPKMVEDALAVAVAEALAAQRARALDASVDTAVQSEPEDPKVAEEAIKAAILAHRTESIEKGVGIATQSEPEDPAIAEAALATAVAEALAAKHASALEKAVDMSIQSDPEDPSIAEAAIATAVAAAVAEALAAKQATQLEKAVDMSIQSDPEDPSIAEAAIATAVAEALAAKHASTLEKSVDVSIQSDPEDPSIAEAAIATAVAEALAAKHASALEKSVDISIQSDPEDPAVVEANLKAAIAADRASSLEKAVTTGIQSEPEDPSIAEDAIKAAILANRAKSIEEGISFATQSDPEDPTIAEAALATAVAAALAAKYTSALERAVDMSIQSDPEDPAIAEAALAAAVAEALAAKQATQLEKSVDVSIQSDPEDPALAEAALAAAVAEALSVQRANALEKSVDSAVQSESIVMQDSGVQVESIDTVDTAVQSEQVETKDSDTQHISQYQDAFVQYEPLEEAGVSIGIQSEDKSTADQQTQSDQLEFIECGVQSDQLNTSDATVQAQLATGIDANTQHSVDKKDAHVQYEEAEHLSTTAILPVPIVATSDDDAFFDASSGIQSAQKEDVNEYNNTTSSDDVRLLNGSDKTPVTPDHIQARSISDKSEPTPVHERSVHNNAVTSIPALSAESTPIETKDVTETHSIVSTIDGQPTEDLPTKETETLLSHHDDVEPPVKMYTKEEADALIAAAVAAAITKVSASHPKDIAALLSESNILEKKPVILSDHAGIHEEEGEKRNETRERDASVLSATSTASFDDDEDDNELSTGTAIVYSEEPSMEYRSFRNLSTGPSTAFDQDPISTPEKTEAPLPPLPELTMGTTAVFSQEPVVVVDDIPARPSSPPPPALLNKATFSDISPISPSSSRSNKGKSPMASSELETYPDIMASEEDVSQRVVSPTYEKGTITSLSTASSTHDHIQSMHTQYDPETDATNPNMIALITQTMIGDWLWKYTRKTVGNGISENRHQRYFWIHPYTRTLYWSNTAPGLNDHGGKAKSALIENIIAVPDFTAGPPGLPNISLLIQTSHRQLKLTAPTMEKHEIWFEAISHLITRQNNNTNGTMSILNDSMRNRSVSSAASKQHSRLHDLFQSPQSITTGDTSQDEDEDIEDVRMCCNGKHHVSKLEKDHLHRHQYRRRRSNVA